jgi:hypothetical protein
MTKYPPGTRVKVAGGSGIDSDKSGTVIAWSDPKAKGMLGILNGSDSDEGYNQRLRGKGWIAILFDDGSVSCQPKSRLSAGGPKVDREESERAEDRAPDAEVDYDRIARQAVSEYDVGPQPFDRPIRREPRERGKGRGRWLALDTMDHIVGCVQRSQQKMTAGGVRDGAWLVRMAFEELQDLHKALGDGTLTDDAWDV